MDAEKRVSPAREKLVQGAIAQANNQIFQTEAFQNITSYKAEFCRGEYVRKPSWKIRAAGLLLWLLIMSMLCIAMIKFLKI